MELIRNPDEAKTIIIYDFGGGTFDISILSISDGQYLEIAKGGNMWLGGDDINNLIINYIKHRTEKEYKIESLDKLIYNLPERKRFLVDYELKMRAEDIKHKLSSLESAIFEFSDFIEDENKDLLIIEYPINRKEFENLIAPLIDETISITKNVLKEINYDIDMIDEAILVGGSSKIPLVQQKMKELFGDKVRYSQEPMLDVTKGAAIVAQRIGSEDLTSEISVDEIKKNFHFDEISHSVSHDVYIITGEKDNEKNDPIFQATEPLPAEKNFILKTLSSNQKIIKFIISTKVKNDKPQNSICFVNIKENLPEGARIYCTFYMDANEEITVNLQIEGHNQKLNYKITRGGAATKAAETIDESINKVNSMNLLPEQIKKAIGRFQKEIDKMISLDPDGTINDNEFWKISYDVGELPDKIKEIELVRDSKESLKNLLGYIEWVLSEYSKILSPMGIDDLRMLRVKLKNIINEDSIIGFEEIEEELNSIIKKEYLVDYLLYIRIAISQSSNENIKNQLNTYHDKIVESELGHNYDLVDKYLREAVPLANQVFESLGQLNRIRTAVKLHR